MGGFLLGAVGILLAAQTAQATIVGTVRDGETAQPLAGAAVMLPDLERATATDSGGRYVLQQVPAGPQHITVRLIGYAQRSLHALVPRDGELEINVSLQRQPVRLQTLDVRAPVIVRGVESADTTAFPDRESSMAAARNHPLLAEPDVFQALGGGEVALRPESPSGVHLRGGASDQTAYLLDGIPVFSPFHAAGVSSAWNPDAIFRLRVSSAAPSLASPHTLSGAIEAVTRAPGAQLRAQGSASTTQARLTIDGPLGVAGAGYMVSLRSGLPAALAPRDDPSFLRGETGDWLAKLEAPVFGGRVRLLGYDSENDVNTAALAEGDAGPSPAPRNVFEWHSQSFGVEWRRLFSTLDVRVLSWRASGDASSVWRTQAAGMEMAAARRDEGLLAVMEHGAAGATTAAGIRIERSGTSYEIESDSVAVLSWGVTARTPVAAGFARHTMAIGQRTELDLGGSLAWSGGDLYPEPRAQLRWTWSERLKLSGSYARTHQFAQSLRNAESVAGYVFPVDLYMGAGAPGVPVASSDQGVIAAEYHPWAGVRLGLQAYERRSYGLLLVAPRDGEPFTTGAFAAGSGRSRGVSADVAVGTARWGMVASYGWQQVRLTYGDSSYVPDNGAAHLLEGGVIFFPTPTASIRLGAVAALERRTTAFTGGFEWEAYNLVDQGFEFGGSPHYGGEPLGGTALPPYFRIDVGVRKHWHVPIGERDALIELFGTVTNVLGWKNVLTYARNPSSGELVEVEMNPRAPLVVGLDWRF